MRSLDLRRMFTPSVAMHIHTAWLAASRAVSGTAMQLTSAIHTKVTSSLIIRLGCGDTLKSIGGAASSWVRGTSSVSAGHPQCTVKIVTNRGQRREELSMSAHRTAVRRGRPEQDGVIVMGADPGIPRVLTSLTGVTRLPRCTRGVPVLWAFAADTGVQVGRPGVGREANALASSLARANDAIRKRPSMALRRAATDRPGSGSARSMVKESQDEGCP